jgi:hypothetical protein
MQLSTIKLKQNQALQTWRKFSWVGPARFIPMTVLLRFCARLWLQATSKNLLFSFGLSPAKEVLPAATSYG